MADTVNSPNDSNVVLDSIVEVTETMNDFLVEDSVVAVGASSLGSMPSVTDNSAISEFLSRPIPIATGTWAIGGTVFNYIDPWTAFLTASTVMDKTRHYARMRADMVIRLVVSGTPYHYGLMRLTYRPHPGLTGANDPYFNLYNSSQSTVQLQNRRMCASQLEYGAYVNPCVTTSEEIRCPYIHYKPGIDLPAGVFNDIGELAVIGFTNLQHANGGTDPVHYTLYAHLENVQMDVATAVPFGFDLKGAIAKGAAYLSAGSKAYALANEAVGPLLSAAAMLGFSRPLTDDLPQNVRNIPYNITNYDMSDTAQRLSLAVSSEMTVDGTDLGTSGEDTLIVNTIASRESFLAERPWDSSQTTGKFMVGSYVSPMQVAVSTYTDEALVAHTQSFLTPSAHVASTARYWSGEMKYRINVVASPYHKGRLRIWYEPTTQYVNGDSAPTNLAASVILDLAETMTAELVIPWMSLKDALECDLITTVNTYTDPVGMGARSGAAGNFCNGYIVVEILNPLTSPSDGTDVAIQLYSAGNGIGLFDPGLPDGWISESTTRVTPFSFDISGGDSIVSVRQLLKRYTHVRTDYIPNAALSTTTLRLYRVLMPMYSPRPGLMSLATPSYDVTTATAQKVNYVGWTFMSYFSQSFALMRGSVRDKMMIWSQSERTNGTRSAYRGPSFTTYSRTRLLESDVPARAANVLFSSLIPTSSVTVQKGSLEFEDGSHGMQLSSGGENGHMDVEIPYISNIRAVNPRAAFWVEIGDNNTRLNRVFTALATGEESESLSAHYEAAGEDFNLFHYIHAPSILTSALPA